MRLARLKAGMRQAARHGRIFHLWWHPHNFGANTKENLDFLRSVLEVFATYRQTHGMRSLSMIEVAAQVTNVEGVIEKPDAVTSDTSAWEQVL